MCLCAELAVGRRRRTGTGAVACWAKIPGDQRVPKFESLEASVGQDVLLSVEDTFVLQLGEGAGGCNRLLPPRRGHRNMVTRTIQHVPACACRHHLQRHCPANALAEIRPRPVHRESVVERSPLRSRRQLRKSCIRYCGRLRAATLSHDPIMIRSSIVFSGSVKIEG